jgi:DNA-binding transcriptional regulator YhcF (GntR family)
MDRILKTFSVERNGTDPLYLQLRKGICNYISLSQIGDKIPSERAISESAGVDRETVRNSIRELINTGILKRGRFGTVIISKSKIEKDRYQGFHPLMGEHFPELAGRTVKTVKLSLYETLPNQKNFWNGAATSFNTTHDDVQIRIEWVPCEISNRNEYLDYIRKNQPDMFLVGNDSCSFFMGKNLLHEIPGTFRTEIGSSFFLKSFSDARKEPRNDFSVPLHFTPWIIIWNLDLAEQLNIGIPENIGNTSALPSFFNKISGNIPDGRIATGSVWNLLLSMGMPGNKFPDLEFFKKRFSLLSPFVNKYGNMFSVTQTKGGFETLERFSRGEMLCYTGLLFYVLGYLDRFSFRFRGEWLAPAKGYHYRESPSRIGINAQSENIEEAFCFIRSFFAENIQKQIIHNRVSCSYHKEAAGGLEKLIPGLDVKNLERVGKYYIPLEPDTEDFLTFGIRSSYYEMMEGQIDISRAANNSYKKLKGDLSPKKEFAN